MTRVGSQRYKKNYIVLFRLNKNDVTFQGHLISEELIVVVN